jgi:hypothetical protein
VLILCSLLYLWEKHGRWLPGSILRAGQESLLVYGVHLWAIFGLLRGKHIGPILGLEMGYLGCFLVSGCVIVAMLSLAHLWHFLKKSYPRPVKLAQGATVAIMILVFVSR